MGYRLGINLGFAINRYIEPEVWTKIVSKDLGLKYVQFVADLLNPYWPETYIEDQIRRIKKSAKEYGIVIESLFSSAYTRVNHLLHPDAEARKFWLDWFKRFLDIGAEFGAKNAGAHFGIMTFDTYNDPDKRKFILDQGVKGWQDLSFYAKEKGYECLIFEPMSVPREMANTVEETRQLMDMVNAHSGVPLKVCLDVGHAPHPSQRDPYPWIEQLAADSPVIHLQQTVLHKSNHAPFTAEQNSAGIITREKVMEAAKKGGCTDALFALEIAHREHWDTDFRIIGDLKESVDYFRPLIPE
ncbi:MAG: sugar phosphate isomerase/epimerase [Spirochaetaceae bacterium]|jgi:sugar phosphate isomerase/epimerase|nr:sugar phosphate isomerase/epimerase [Spirochaetaceae bacterium]